MSDGSDRDRRNETGMSLDAMQAFADDMLEREAARQRAKAEWRAAGKLDAGPSPELLAALGRADHRRYMQWLKGYMRSNRFPNKAHMRPFPKNWRVAKRDFVLDRPLVADHALQIIVPCGIQWYGLENLGECNVYDMQGYRHSGTRVPVFTDTKFFDKKS